MNIVFILIAVLWTARLLTNILSYAYLWWLKEYRFDRMWIHLQTPQGHRILLPALRVPRISPKTVAITVGSTAILLLLFLSLSAHVLLRFIILDILTFPITGILVGIVYVPTFVYHQIRIQRATGLLRQHKPMIVIGITGSFGKTSTKEFLATILSGKYRVLKTEASKNSPIGIAETVLKNLQPDHEVFIVEMGAYKRGEIRVMTDMVQPQIGVVTGINPQHQDLFGSMETTMRAKYELIEGLQGKGIAIINADNPYTRKMAEWADGDGKTVWWFTKEKAKGKRQKANVNTIIFFALDIKTTLEDLQFTCAEGEKKIKVHVQLLGEHQVSNVLAAIAAAVAAGMSVTDAAKAAKLIQPFPKTMELMKGINEATFINDTFNNNPDAAKAAISFLAKTKGRKILVFQPMVELGNYAAVSHQETGREAGRVCDDILLTNSNFNEHILRGAREVNAENKVRVLSAKDAVSYIRHTAQRGDTVLFKGKESERVLHLCFKK